MLSEGINMIEMKVTPEIIRNIIKEKDRLITTEQAEMFLNLFGQQIEDAVRETIKQEVRKHYEWDV